MNIAVFDDLPEGGAKRVVWEHVKGLSRSHEVYSFTNEVSSQFNVEPFVKKLIRLDLRLHSHHGIARPLQELSLATHLVPQYRRIANWMNELRVDVVLVHPSRLTQAPILLSMLQQPSVYFAEEWPRVVYEPEFHSLPVGFHGIYEWCRRQGVRLIDRWQARTATAIVGTSRYMVEKLSTIYERNVELLPLGVDLNTFCLPSRARKQHYFLFFGEREAISGYPLLSQVLSNTRFAVKQVTLKGTGFRYTDGEIAKLYQRAIATLCLAENEPFGLTALESMACGTPVIAVRSGGYLDTVVSGQNGLVVEPSAVAVVEAMRWMLDNREDAAIMGRNGRAWVEAHYDWDHHIKQLERILRKVL